jgi:hypothetical protein
MVYVQKIVLICHHHELLDLKYCQFSLAPVSISEASVDSICVCICLYAP